MINLEKNIIYQGLERNEPIRKWLVWWRGPNGLYALLEEACTAAKLNDIDPNLCIHPVVIAWGSDQVWEEFNR